MECDLAALKEDARRDLGDQLSKLTAEQQSPAAQNTARVLVRSKIADGMLDINQAAKGVGCSESFLKSKIPCTDYTYDEIDGKKVIRDYFWSPQLIERLSQVKQHGVKADDVKQFADECCYGDGKWAEEVLTSLYRPKSAAKAEGSQPGGATKRPDKVAPKGNSNNRHWRKKTS